jgi:CheY-like chemotaxis protein
MNEHKLVLIIDDDASIRELVRAILVEEGYLTATANHGAEALAFLEYLVPDLIISDMRMPVMDGWHFAMELRARHDNQVPLLVMTAAVDAAKRAAEVDAAGAISKPFDLDDLVQQVRATIGDGHRSPPRERSRGA